MADITGIIYGTTSNSLIDSKIEWEETVSIVSNQGTVTARLYLRTRTGYVTSSANSTFTTYIGSASSGEGINPFSIGPSDAWVLADTTYAYVAHNSDGTKSITISATGNMSGASVSSITCSATVALYAIPRASTFTLPATVDVNGTNSVAVDIARKSGAYTHRVRIYTESTYAGSTYKTEQTGVETSFSYAIPESWRLSMPTSVSKEINVEVTTYNGAAQIGNPQYGKFTITVPASVKPIVDATNVTLAPVQADEISAFTHYVRGLSACGATFDSLASDFSSEVAISSFYIQVGGATTSTAPYNTAPFGATGDFSITVGVTDARGRTGTYTQTITVYPYDEPLVEGLTVFRSDGSGVASNTGGYVAITGTTSFSSCGGDNSIVYYRARYKAASSGSYGAWANLTSGGTTVIGGGALLSTTSYNVEVQVVDEVGGTTTYSYIIPTASVTFNVKDGGLGAAFFKYAETDGVLDVAGDVKAVGGTFTGEVAATGNVTANSFDPVVPITVANGGTGADNPITARANLGAAAANHEHAVADITGVLPLDKGGTGVNAASTAALVTALGLGLSSATTPAATPKVGTLASFRIHKIGKIVVLQLRLSAVSASAGITNLGTLIPVAYRPYTGCGDVGLAVYGSVGDTGVVKSRLTEAGAINIRLSGAVGSIAVSISGSWMTD